MDDSLENDSLLIGICNTVCCKEGMCSTICCKEMFQALYILEPVILGAIKLVDPTESPDACHHDLVAKMCTGT